MRILLVHNDRWALEVLRWDVVRCYPGCQITAFSEANEAAEYIHQEEESIDLCFAQVKMKGMSGFQILQKLRENGKKAMMVFLSDTNEYAMDAWRQGARDYLLEPVTLDSVRHTLLSCAPCGTGLR